MGGLGSKMSSVNSLIVGDTLGLRYDIYKTEQLGKKDQPTFDYFKVEDLLDLNRKKAVEPILIKSKMPQRLFKLIKLINHPSILKADYFIEDDCFFVVRTYGDDCYGFWWRLQIQKYLEAYKKHIKIEEDQIVYWLKQILTVADCLHYYNVLHKFYIPQIFSFERDQIKVFIPATSVILDNEEDAVEVEKTWYKCPEHVATKHIGLKYDIWSIGWTLYNICSLNDPRDLLDKVQNFEEFVRPEIPRHYTRDLDRVFRLMTQTDPYLRPTAEELLEDPIFKPFENK